MVLLAGCWLATLGAYVLAPSQRFIRDMPNDNEIPRMFADKLIAGESPTYGGDWLSSDRPPLQTGIELSLRPWHLSDSPATNYRNYHRAAILLQMIWVPTLFAFGRVLQLSRTTILLVLLICATSGFFLFNSLYVWPKLLAASLFLIALGILLVGVRDHSAGTLHATVAAGCASLGLLAHGGVAFSVLALPALPAAWVFLRQVRLRGLLGALCVFLVLYMPWRAYQVLYDPPGDRLWKWHIAGVIAVDQRSFTQALRDQYRQLTFAQWLQGKRANLETIFTYPDNPKPWQLSADYLRSAQVYNQIPALDVLPVGLLALLLTRRRSRLGTRSVFLHQLLFYVASHLAIWVLLMFIPASCVVHHGSYVATVLLFFLGAVGLAEGPPLLRWPLLAVHVGLFFWVWLATTPPYPESVLRPPVALVSVILGFCFVGSLRLLPDER